MLRSGDSSKRRSRHWRRSKESLLGGYEPAESADGFVAERRPVGDGEKLDTMTTRRTLEIVVVVAGMVILLGSLVYLAAGLTLTG